MDMNSRTAKLRSESRQEEISVCFFNILKQFESKEVEINEYYTSEHLRTS